MNSRTSTSFRIAIRYLFSRKRHAAVNVVSMVAVAALMVAVAAMVIVMSVFNGFATLAESQISRLAPPFEVSPQEGRYIADADSVASRISSELGSPVVAVLSARGLAVAGDRQIPVSLMGVSPEFVELSGLTDAVIDGIPFVSDSVFNFSVASVGVAVGLDTRPGDYRFVDIYAPRRVGRISSTNPMRSVRTDSLLMAGVCRLDQEMFDSDLLIVPISVVRNLLDLSDDATSLYVYTDSREGVERAVSSEGFTVRDTVEQFPSTFRMISMEKWVTMALLTFILIISSFNIISTMSMLVIEKEPNAAILRAMGAGDRFVRRVYLFEGWLITLAGTIAGLILGVVVTLVQQFFHIVKIGDGNADSLAITSYPVELRPTDLLFVVLICLAVGAVSVTLSVRK